MKIEGLDSSFWSEKDWEEYERQDLPELSSSSELEELREFEKAIRAAQFPTRRIKWKS